MKNIKYVFLSFLFLCFFFPAEYQIKAENKVILASKTEVPAMVKIQPAIANPKTYSTAEILSLTASAHNSSTIRTLIQCESENQNIARMDSNGLMSYGLLQFNGTATWSEYSQLDAVNGSPMNPVDAIKVADYMIDQGQLHRWTCAKITGLIK